MPERYIYLDYAATAPVRPEARAAAEAWAALPESEANPNSLHTLGRRAAMGLEDARRRLARCIGGGFRSAEVAFTGGGTEANNICIFGMAEGARARDARRSRVILSAIEHDSVLDCAAPLRSRGFEVAFVEPDRTGRIQPSALEALMGDDVALVSVMSANNETGVIQPIGELAEVAHAAGAVLHTDAIQAFGRVPLEAAAVDALTIAGHKIGAPPNTGALALRNRCPFVPQSFGGGQEDGRRAGTQDVAGARMLAAVAEYVCAEMDELRPQVAARAQVLSDEVCADPELFVPTVDLPYDEERLPGIVSVMAPHIDSETLILKLDAQGFEVSAGSACSSASLDPSHVLVAMGIERQLAAGALRISFDERVGEADLHDFAQTLCRIAAELVS